jgi:microcystin-dependent protein
MAEPFLSEIRIMSFDFAPKGWATCNGQLLPINQNQALFSLLGTTYGGNGQTTFGLPNLQGKVPIHVGNGHTLGEAGGQQAHTLTISEMPAHNHFMFASTAKAPNTTGGTQPGGKVLAEALAAQANQQTTPVTIYGTGARNRVLALNAIGNVGGSQAHLNMQPFLTLNFCIALQGIFPSPN